MMSETPDILCPAIRQYRKQQEDQFICAFDRDTTVEIVEKLESQVTRLVEMLKEVHLLPKNTTSYGNEDSLYSAYGDSEWISKRDQLLSEIVGEQTLSEIEDEDCYYCGYCGAALKNDEGVPSYNSVTVCNEKCAEEYLYTRAEG